MHFRVKCDRKQPCDTCRSHGLAASCEYPRASAEQKPVTEQTKVISKLNHLENLIQTLMSDRSGQPSSQPSNSQPGVNSRISSQTVDALPTSFGRLSLDRTEPNYVGSDHWAAIIDGVSFTIAAHEFPQCHARPGR